MLHPVYLPFVPLIFFPSTLFPALYDLHHISCAMQPFYPDPPSLPPSLCMIIPSNVGTIFPLYQWGQYCIPPRVTPCQLARHTLVARTHRAVSTPLCCTRRYVSSYHLLFYLSLSPPSHPPVSSICPSLFSFSFFSLSCTSPYLSYATTTYSLFRFLHFSSTSTYYLSLSVCFLSVQIRMNVYAHMHLYFQIWYVYMKLHGVAFLFIMH